MDLRLEDRLKKFLSNEIPSSLDIWSAEITPTQYPGFVFLKYFVQNSNGHFNAWEVIDSKSIKDDLGENVPNYFPIKVNDLKSGSLDFDVNAPHDGFGGYGSLLFSFAIYLTNKNFGLNRMMVNPFIKGDHAIIVHTSLSSDNKVREFVRPFPQPFERLQAYLKLELQTNAKHGLKAAIYEPMFECPNRYNSIFSKLQRDSDE